MLCPKCGYNNTSSTVCANCGAALTQGIPQGPHAPSPSRPPGVQRSTAPSQPVSRSGGQQQVPPAARNLPQLQNQPPPPPARSGTQQQISRSRSYGGGTGRASSNIVGEVQRLRRDTEQKMNPFTNQGSRMETWKVWSFLVVVYDNFGNPLQQVPVQMRGRKIDGELNDGDTVEVPGRWTPGKILEVNSVYNQTFQHWVETKYRSGGERIVIIVTIVLFIIILCIILFFFFGIWLPGVHSFGHP